MRLLIAECTVNYEGRLSAHLPQARRLIMIKADGCVAIHADGGAYKPLNWMNAPNLLTESDDEIRVLNPKGELLTITLYTVESDTSADLGMDPGLQKDGVEAHLQEMLSTEPTRLEDGMLLIRREYPTEIGPVDMLCRDSTGKTVAVEIKRRGEIDGVEQLTRYLDFLNRITDLAPVRGMFVAQEIKPQAKILASDREISWVEVDYDELRGVERPQQKLF
jgi:RecB family endonuclease NucS